MSPWRQWANGALSALLAPPCATCGETVPRPLEGAVCDGCWARVEPFPSPVCTTCGLPLPSQRIASLQAGRCGRCWHHPPVLARQAAVGPHDGTLREIVHSLKYRARHSTAPHLGALMRRAGTHVLQEAHVAVPVPLHWTRTWTRGVNQAALLARHLGLPVAPLIARRRATPAQVQLPASRRRQNVRHAFTWQPRVAARTRARLGVPVEAMVVVLVDDVCTTGATLDACARTLLERGVAEVRALTASRAVHAPRG